MKDIRHLSKEEKIKIIKKEGEKEIFDLRGSNLRLSDLRVSDLRVSDLRFSDLRGSDLRRSDLSLSDLRDAKIDETTKFSKIKIKRDQVDIILKQMFEIEE